MQTTTDAPTMMKAPEVAERLNIRLPRVYDLTRQGILPHVRLNKQLRYDPGAIEDFIRSGGTAGDEA